MERIFKTSIEVETQSLNLFYKGKVLRDNDLLSFYRIDKPNTIYEIEAKVNTEWNLEDESTS